VQRNQQVERFLPLDLPTTMRMAAFAKFFLQLAKGDLASAIEARLPGLPDNPMRRSNRLSCSNQHVIAVRQTRATTNLRELWSYTESPRLTHAGYRLLNTTALHSPTTAPPARTLHRDGRPEATFTKQVEEEQPQASRWRCLSTRL
jgi:hypothetical protein